LVAQQQNQGGGNNDGGNGTSGNSNSPSNNADDHRQRLVDLTDRVLRWSFNQLDTDGSTPASLDAWRQQLTQEPYNFDQQQLSIG
jgi:hypothetical protein